jgi:hypothetical protein
MATFYLLPSRLAMGQRFGDFLSAAFPGLNWRRGEWADLAETLAAAAAGHPGVYVVFREDLTDEHDPEESLARDFGAEAGDDIIEIHSSQAAVRRWKMSALV